MVRLITSITILSFKSVISNTKTQSNANVLLMVPKRKSRIFVGLYETGDLTLRLSQGLRHWGFHVTNVVCELPSPILEREIKHDRYIRRGRNNYVYQLRLIIEFLRQILRHDIFVFNWGQSFTGYLQHSGRWLLRSFAYCDLAILKLLGKKIIVFVVGNDIRSPRLLIEEMKQAGLTQHAKYAAAELDMNTPESEEIRSEKAKRIERYADHIFTRSDCAQFLKRDYYPLWLPVDLESLRFSEKENSNSIVVLHAPSEPRVKGTKYVLEAVERLKREGFTFQFDLCSSMKNSEIMEKLGSAQIAIDQLILPGYGLFAVEAMGSGCAVLGSAVPGYNGFPAELPIMTTTPDTIYKHLKLLLEDRELRTRMSLEGRAYAQKYHDHKKVSKNFLRLIGEI
jgi:glycosyltransferase involved in cell wall biosynthesis